MRRELSLLCPGSRSWPQPLSPVEDMLRAGGRGECCCLPDVLQVRTQRPTWMQAPVPGLARVGNATSTLAREPHISMASLKVVAPMTACAWLEQKPSPSQGSDICVAPTGLLTALCSSTLPPPVPGSRGSGSCQDTVIFASVRPHAGHSEWPHLCSNHRRLYIQAASHVFKARVQSSKSLQRTQLHPRTQLMNFHRDTNISSLQQGEITSRVQQVAGVQTAEKWDWKEERNPTVRADVEPTQMLELAGLNQRPYYNWISRFSRSEVETWKICLKTQLIRGVWVAQWVGHPTLGFRS